MKLTLSAFFTLTVPLAMLVKVLLDTVTFLMWLDESPDSLMANGAPLITSPSMSMFCTFGCTIGPKPGPVRL